LLRFSSAELFEPDNSTDASDLMERFKHNITTVIFVDPANINLNLEQENADLTEESKKGFFSNFFETVTSIFSSKDKSIGDIVHDLSKKNIVIEIDATNPEFRKLQDIYNVQTVPFIIILKGNKILYRAPITEKTDEKVASILEAYNEDLNASKKKNIAPSEAKTMTPKNNLPKESTVVTISPENAQFKTTKADNLYNFGNVPKASPVNYTYSESQTFSTPTVPTIAPRRSPSSYSTTSTSERYIPPTVTYGQPVGSWNSTSQRNYAIQRQPVPRNLDVNTTAPSLPSEITYPMPTEFNYPPMMRRNITTTQYFPTPFGFRASDDAYNQVGDRWMQVLKEEEKMVDEIKQIYEDDSKLSSELLESEAEIHESEELFYKARNEIEKTLVESEKQMRL
jgi:hypothetical protein